MEERLKYKKDIAAAIIQDSVLGFMWNYEVVLWLCILPTAFICGICLFKFQYVQAVILYNFARDFGFSVDESLALYTQGNLVLDSVCSWTGTDYVSILERYHLPVFAAIITFVMFVVSALLITVHNKRVEKRAYTAIEDTITPKEARELEKVQDTYEYATLCGNVIKRIRNSTDYKPFIRFNPMSFLSTFALMLLSYSLGALIFTGIEFNKVAYTDANEFFKAYSQYTVDDTYSWYIDNLEVEWNED